VPCALIVIAFLAWTVVVATERNARGALGPAVPAVLTGAALLAAAALVRDGRSGRAFVFTAFAAAGWIATLFTALYPRVLVSHPAFADSLTVSGAAAEHYALVVITVVAAIFTPLVLAYQAWTYHVLRARVGAEPVKAPPSRAPTPARAEPRCARWTAPAAPHARGTPAPRGGRRARAAHRRPDRRAGGAAGADRRDRVRG
jgi:cytochrome d ubiquinol oxidase subunit II